MESGGKEGVAVPSAQYATLSLTQRLLVAVFLIAGVGYFAWRPGTFNPDAPVDGATRLIRRAL